MTEMQKTGRPHMLPSHWPRQVPVAEVRGRWGGGERMLTEQSPDLAHRLNQKANAGCPRVFAGFSFPSSSFPKSAPNPSPPK